MIRDSEQQEDRLNSHAERGGIQVFISMLQVSSNDNSRLGLRVFPVRVKLMAEDKMKWQLLAACSAGLEGSCVGDERSNLAANGILDRLGSVVLGSILDGEIEDLFFVSLKDTEMRSGEDG